MFPRTKQEVLFYILKGLQRPSGEVGAGECLRGAKVEKQITESAKYFQGNRDVAILQQRLEDNGNNSQ